MTERCLVVMPTYNHVGTVTPLVDEILLVGDLLGEPLINVLIIDDNSRDGTARAADGLRGSHSGRVAVLHRLERLGAGSAYRVGFRYALASGYDYVVQMEADFSHDPSSLPELLRAARNADLVLGSRHISALRSEKWPLWRQLLGRSGSYFARLVLGMPVSDPTTAFKCFRRRALSALDLGAIRSDGYAFQVEVTYRCLQPGLRVVEVPVSSHRASQRSRLSGRLVWEALLGIWQLRSDASSLGQGRAGSLGHSGRLTREPISQRRMKTGR